MRKITRKVSKSCGHLEADEREAEILYGFLEEVVHTMGPESEGFQEGNHGRGEGQLVLLRVEIRSCSWLPVFA